jgi:molybdopterin converting factor small subunit
MVVLRLFAAAREAAGTGRAEMTGATVSEVLAEARDRFGDDFAQVLTRSRVWVNGQPGGDDSPLSATDEVAVLPPVSGGIGGP